MHPKWYHVCWPRLTAKRVEPVVSIRLYQLSLFFYNIRANTAIVIPQILLLTYRIIIVFHTQRQLPTDAPIQCHIDSSKSIAKPFSMMVSVWESGDGMRMLGKIRDWCWFCAPIEYALKVRNENTCFSAYACSYCSQAYMLMGQLNCLSPAGREMSSSLVWPTGWKLCALDWGVVCLLAAPRRSSCPLAWTVYRVMRCSAINSCWSDASSKTVKRAMQALPVCLCFEL